MHSSSCLYLTHISQNCPYLCFNPFPFVFPSFWYTTCPYKKYFQFPSLIILVVWQPCWFVTLPLYIFLQLDSSKFKSPPLWYCLYFDILHAHIIITNIIYKYAISIIFQIYCMAAILIWFVLPAYSYTNCIYVCCNDFPLLFPLFW